MKCKNELGSSRKRKRNKSLQFAKPRIELSAIGCVGENHLAWEIIIPKLDYRSQLKISQQNKQLTEIAKLNAEANLRKFRRHIQEDKYM